MRIGILASLNHPIRPPFAGGLERHTHQLAHGLLARGHDVVVFAAADADPALPLQPIRDCSTPLRLSEAAAGDVSMVSDRFIEEHHCYTGVMRAVDDHGLDVLHVNSTHYVPVTMAGDVATPVTLTLHTPPTPWLESAFAHAGGRRPLVQAVSSAIARQWRATVDVDGVILNGVDLDHWRPRAGDVGDHAVWTGRITPEKGTLDAVRAARRAGVPIRVAGPIGHVEYGRDVLAALGPHDEYVGHLGGDDLVDLVAGAAVQVVTPRWEEPYGLVVAEALACGTPVAGYRRGGLPEIVDDASGVLVAPGDVEALAAAIPAAAALDRGACRARAELVADERRMVVAYERVLASAGAAA